MSEHNWEQHQLMVYDSVKRWMTAKRSLKDRYRWQALEALRRYCEFRGANPDELIHEHVIARREEEPQLRLVPEDHLNKFFQQITAGNTKSIFAGNVLLKRIKPFYNSNGCPVAVVVSMPEAPAHENTVQATPEITKRMVDAATKLQTKWGFLCMGENGMRPTSVTLLQWKNVTPIEEWEAGKPLRIVIPGKITKTGLPYKTFALDDAKEVLRMIWEQQRPNLEDRIMNCNGQQLMNITTQTAVKIGINQAEGLKPFTTGSWREYVQNALEDAGIPPNWVSLLMGARPRAGGARDAHYTNPPIEKLEAQYMKAAPSLIVYKEFMGKTTMPKLAFSKEDAMEVVAKALEKAFATAGRGQRLSIKEFRRRVAEQLTEEE